MSVLSDPTVGPYDGADDTLVGVQNDSTRTVEAVTMSSDGSSGVSLSGFDGDGLCDYAPVSGCPFGPTGYEGPGTAFVVDTALPETVEVDFGGPAGLPAGSSTYFSLEGSFTQATLTAHQGHLGGYAALGDSYSSGEGLGAYRPDSNTKDDMCHRSAYAYGPLFDRDAALGDFKFVACSGATTSDVLSPSHLYPGEPAQVSQSQVPTDTKEVTLTIGGDDVGFLAIAKKCVWAGGLGPVPGLKQPGHPGCNRDAQFTAGVTARLRALAGNGTATVPGTNLQILPLVTVLGAIHTQAPNAQVYILGYPRPFGDRFDIFDHCRVGTVNTKIFGLTKGLVGLRVTRGDAQWIDDVASRLNSTISAAAPAANAQAGTAYVTVVNPDRFFIGHRLCGSGTPWIGKISVTLNGAGKPVPKPSSAHPTMEGQRFGYEAALLATLASEPSSSPR